MYSFDGGFGNFSDKCTKKNHDATDPIMIGGFPVWLGKGYEIKQEVLLQADFICPLNGDLPRKGKFGHWMMILGCELPDRGGVPPNWKQFIEYVAKLIRSGKKCVAYCTGSHGRTGTFAASLIAVMEPETADPIAAVRERHCEKAVESLAQAKAIFELRDQELPEDYAEEFKPKVTYSGSSGELGFLNGYREGGVTFKPFDSQWPPRSIDNQELYLRFQEAWSRCIPLKGWEGPDNAEFPGKVILWIGPSPRTDLIVPVEDIKAVLTILSSLREHPSNWNPLAEKYQRPFKGNSSISTPALLNESKMEHPQSIEEYYDTFFS